MCGIFGCSLKPKANRAAALEKFKILGLYNISRGRDATGIYIDGKINKSLKEFDDYIEEGFLNKNFKQSIILGHNRQGSVGYGKTLEQAHPFLINENLVFTHNGTIKNTADLCKKYDINEKDFNVDSDLLGTLLFTEGSDVLTHYKGAAALAYTYIDSPDTLYLYHGQSKDYKHGSLIEERPLFFLETKDGLFYSSLESSLNAIRENKEEKVEILNYNKIFKIENGDFLLDETVTINREEANVTVYLPINNYNHSSHYDGGHSKSNMYNYNKNNNLPVTSHINKDLRLIFKESYPNKLIESAKTDFKIYNEQFIYYHMGRYWIAPKTLVDGPIYLKKRGILGSYDDKVSELFFFFRGVLLKDKAAYNVILDKKNRLNDINWVLNPEQFNFASEIAKYSQFPVTALASEYNLSLSEFYRCAWYAKDDKKHHSFTPKFAGRNYIINEGYLIDIKTSDHNDKCLFASNADVAEQFAQIYKKKGISGGNSELLIPFQEPKKEKIFTWFFENVYENMEEVLKDWTEDEFEVLKEYVDISYNRDFSMVLKEDEITENMEYLIEKAIKEKISLGELINQDNAGDSVFLLKLYNEYLNKKDLNSKVKTMTTSTIDSKLEEIEAENDDIRTKEDEIEYISDIIEDSLVDLENIQSSSFDLQAEDESDYAQEVAKILLIGVDSILSNIKNISCEFPEKSKLENRIDKIREKKNIKNGTL